MALEPGETPPKVGLQGSWGDSGGGGEVSAGAWGSSVSRAFKAFREGDWGWGGGSMKVLCDGTPFEQVECEEGPLQNATPHPPPPPAHMAKILWGPLTVPALHGQ